MGDAVGNQFDLVLQSYLPQEKIRVIAAVSHLTGSAMNEAKGLVERTPVVVKARLRREEAEALKRDLESGFWPGMRNFERLPAGERCCTVEIRATGGAKDAEIRARIG